MTAKELQSGDELMVISAKAHTARLVGDDLPSQGRGTQGKLVLELETGDYIVEVTRVAEKEAREEDAEDEPLELAEEDAMVDQFDLLTVADGGDEL